MNSVRVRGFLTVAAVAVVILSPAVWRTTARPTYVVTAIDYHFHDAHPTTPIAPGRDLVVKNVGRNVHNVTIPGTTYSQDVPPGDQLVIRDIAAFLRGPGEYPFFCRFHQSLRMTGVIVIAR
ncbi:MAG TPA: cupredoxin domain-containing protein [Actinomycetota bacterium]|nr:cupredoxin domain-containing protein [Actinomycetota bacterium]